MSANFPKVTKKDLILEIQSQLREETDTLLSQALLTKLFDINFEAIIKFLEEGKEVTTPLGVIEFKTIPDTVRRDIGRNTTLPVKGYNRPRLALNSAVKKRFATRGYSFLSES